MCLGIYCLWSVAYTSVNVPYGSMQSCITNDPAGRSSLSQWRSIGAMCAQIPIMILLPLLVYDKNDNPRGELFIIFVGVMGAIGLVSFYLLRRMTTERIAAAQPQEKQKFNYFATLGSFFKNKPMMGVTISTVAYLALMMTVTTSMPYIFMCKSRNFERTVQKRRDGKLHFAQKIPPHRCSHRVRGWGLAGKFAAGQSVKVQHSFQCGNVGVHV